MHDHLEIYQENIFFYKNSTLFLTYTLLGQKLVFSQTSWILHDEYHLQQFFVTVFVLIMTITSMVSTYILDQ